MTNIKNIISFLLNTLKLSSLHRSCYTVNILDQNSANNYVRLIDPLLCMCELVKIITIDHEIFLFLAVIFLILYLLIQVIKIPP